MTVSSGYADAFCDPLPQDELVSLQRVAAQARLAVGLVRSQDAPAREEVRQARTARDLLGCLDPDLLALKVLFGLPLRQTVGLVESLIRMAGLDWPVPDYATLCRRQASIAVQIPYRASGQPLNLRAADSTGIKFRG